MAHPNIYPNVVLQLPPRLKEILLQFGREGQIDCDRIGYPYLLQVVELGKNVQAMVVRNGKVASIILNPRSRTQEPDISWDKADGYRAKTGNVQISAPSRQERQMRESYSYLVDQIMESI